MGHTITSGRQGFCVGIFRRANVKGVIDITEIGAFGTNLDSCRFGFGFIDKAVCPKGT